MSNLAIRIDGIGKRYRIGMLEERPETLAGAALGVLKAPLKSFRDLRKLSAFGEAEEADVLWALRDISFDVKHGEVVGLIGRNGAGKSTLLKVLSRITEPTTGRIDLYGRVASLLEVGTGFHPDLTGRENAYLNGTILGMKKAEVDRKFDEIVAFSEIEKFIDTPVKRYSSGMKVRLAFSVAAHLEPEILLVDEVLAVGDVAFQKKCLGKMDDVAGEGRTVIFVSHHMSMIQALCQRGVVLENGQVAFDGSVNEAVNKYIKYADERLEGVEIGDLTDRRGGEEFRFTGVQFFDAEEGVPVASLMTGRAVRAEVRYDNRTDRTLNGVTLALGFRTLTEALITALSSEAIGKTFDIPPGPGTVTCIIPRLPLSSGRYRLMLNARQRGGYLDLLKAAKNVDVEAGDYFGYGVVPGSSHQTVMVDYDWEQEAHVKLV